MKNKALRSFLLLLVYFPVLMLVMLTPAYAITTTIKPTDAIINSTTDAYTATLDPTGGPEAGFFILNITIPAGYNLILPAAGKTVGNYTMLNKTTGTNKVIINITSSDPDNDKVNVAHSTDYGANYSTDPNKNISNMSIGVATLKITKPTDTTAGFLNISLAGAGPIDPTLNSVTIKLANGTLRNPSTEGSYTWYLEAKLNSTEPAYTSSNVVNIKAGASSVVTIPTFNASIPANASLPLPSGNLTVNISTTSAVNVSNLVITLRNFSSDPNSSATAGAEGLSRIMFFGIDAPALSGVSFTARISINYSSVVSTLTIPEENLRIYRFNASTSAWEATSNNTVDTTNKIVYGNVTGFSTFALMGAAAGGAGGGGGGGGGTGGGGVTTSEPFDNIAKAERYDKNLIADTPVTYAFTAPEHGIYEIVVTGKENENTITLRVEALKGTSKLVTASPPGTVYKNVNVWLGSKRIKEALIRFKVENLWISSNSFANSDVKLIKWDGSKWVQLETTETNKDAAFTYYEAKTDTLSVFAITGLKAVVGVPTPSEVTPAKTVVPEVTEKPTPGFEAVLTIFAIALSVVLLIKGRKRR